MGNHLIASFSELAAPVGPAFSPQHYSVWQSTGSCPGAPTISALQLVMQCSQTLIMLMMRYFLHNTQEGGRQISNVPTKQQPPWACTLHGKRL